MHNKIGTIGLALVGIIIGIAIGYAFGYDIGFERSVKENNTSTNGTMLENGKEDKVIAESMSYFNEVKGFYARPNDKKAYPGVVMIHEWWGLNENIKDMARTLAAEGYAVLAVDLYNGEVAQTQERARELRTTLNQEEALENMKTAVAYLEAQGATKIASLGWCFGGGQSLQLAVSGDPLDATVIYYGTVVTSTDALGNIDWPVLGIFGQEDQSIPPKVVSEFDTALTRAGVDHAIHNYPGVGHAFANPSGANYAPEETKDAWAKTLEFFRKNLN